MHMQIFCHSNEKPFVLNVWEGLFLWAYTHGLLTLKLQLSNWVLWANAWVSSNLTAVTAG
jgi:hypothetical protein